MPFSFPKMLKYPLAALALGPCEYWGVSACLADSVSVCLRGWRPLFALQVKRVCVCVVGRREIVLGLQEVSSANRGLFICQHWIMIRLSVLFLGAHTQMQLVASGPGTEEVAKPITLTCTASGVSVTSDYTWFWYRQAHGKRLEVIAWGYYSSSKWYPATASSFQGWATTSVETSKNQFFLQLKSLTVADTSTYYCCVGTQ